MSTKTLKELIAEATPGKWPMRPIYPGYKWIDILAPGVRVDNDDVNHDEARANAELISRCNPETMLKAYEVLEALRPMTVGMRRAPDYADTHKHEHFETDLTRMIDSALALLDGKEAP